MNRTSPLTGVSLHKANSYHWEGRGKLESFLALGLRVLDRFWVERRGDPHRISFVLGFAALLLAPVSLAAAGPDSGTLSRPVPYGLGVEDSRFRFSFLASAGITYEVQHVNTLGSANWTSFLSVAGTNGPVTVMDPTPLAASRFFRVVANATRSTVPAAEVRAVAQGINAQVEAGTAFNPADISSLFSALGIPTLTSADRPVLQAMLEAGKPFLLDKQAQSIASKLEQSFFISLDSFIAEMVEKGAKGLGGQPLTRAYLTSLFAPLVSQAEYGLEELVPALILALGRERGISHPEINTDAIWGDDLLDPIQFHLLLYSFVYASASPVSGTRMSDTAPSRSGQVHALGIRPQGDFTWPDWATDWAEGKARDWVTGQIGDAIEFPLGDDDSVLAVFCASILLYSYEVELTVDENNLWHRSDPSEGPYETYARATVTFNFHFEEDSLYKDLQEFIITSKWGAGCTIPKEGPQDSVQVEWELIQKLPDHGSLTDADKLTWNGGQAKAKYRTIDEPVPKALRAVSPKKTTMGWVKFRILNLVPKWSKLEAAVRAVKQTLGAKTKMITINYYDWPELSLEFQSHLAEPSTGLDCFVVGLVPLQRKPQGEGEKTTYVYEGSSLEDYRQFTMAGEGNYWVRVGLDPGTLRVGIPVQSDSAAEDFKVLVDIGSPKENVLITAPGAPPLPMAWTWFGANWKAAHDSDSNMNPPYVGYYAITGWEMLSARVLQRKYDRPFGPYVESTTFKLVAAGSP